MANLDSPEPYRERFDLLVEVIDGLKKLQADFGKVAQVVKEEDELDLETAEQVVTAWLTVLEDEYIRKGFEESADNPVGDASIHWVTTPVLRSVQSSIEQLNKVMTSLEGLPTVLAWVGQLRDDLKGVLQKAKGFGVEGLSGAIHKRRLAEAEGMLQLLEAQRNIRRIETNANQALDRTEAAASKASEAAGVTSESVMASHYKAMADGESAKAGNFRLWTMVSTLFAGATAGVFLLGPALGWEAIAIDASDWVHLIQRAIVTAAIFAFAAYLARQAHQHRSMANWAGSLAVQLQTFEAFLAPISSEEVQDQLRVSFAGRAFGDHPTIKGEPVGAGSSALTEKAIDLLAKNAGK
ncbi:hypothetical protein OHC50_12525 [Paenarthrobacter ilicis]|uniref:hypothetical protein n=1 Tax=Paenarthrobacter ilicis TaxID=43665 RepID=UPI00300823CC